MNETVCNFNTIKLGSHCVKQATKHEQLARILQAVKMCNLPWIAYPGSQW